MHNVFRNNFNKSEDRQLIELVHKYGESNWDEISEYLPGRNPRQCRDRWLKHLSPKINHSPFTPEEDQRLLKLREEIGPKWILISQRFKNRTDNILKSRYKQLMRINAKKNVQGVNEKNITDESSQQAELNENILDTFNDVMEVLEMDDFFKS